MGRPRGSRNALIRVTFDVIAEMAGGITGDTARRYAQRGLFDSRDLESILRWVNERRKRQGEPLIGLPTDDASQADSHDTAADTPGETRLRPEDIKPAAMAGGLTYDPTTGRFGECE
jgi:hypothetical protein